MHYYHFSIMLGHNKQIQLLSHKKQHLNLNYFLNKHQFLIHFQFLNQLQFPNNVLHSLVAIKYKIKLYTTLESTVLNI